jgi:hypothetical protein
MDLSADQEAIDYARGALAEAPPNALILTETDQHTFALWYGRLALGLRPDTVVVDRVMLHFPWYRDHIRRQYPDLRLPEHGAIDGPALARGELTDRPIVVTDPDSGWNTPLAPGTFVHRLLRPGGAPGGA